MVKLKKTEVTIMNRKSTLIAALLAFTLFLSLAVSGCAISETAADGQVTPAASEQPTPAPIQESTPAPIQAPTPAPTPAPSGQPAPAPSEQPTPVPTEAPEEKMQLRIENGALQPILEYSSPRGDYSNAESDILRFCVYVETDNDTDNDGMADLVKAFVQVPRGAVEGDFKAGVIYDPTPYGAGTVEENSFGAEHLYVEEPFDYQNLYRECKKRETAGETTSMELAMEADGSDWNYTVPVSGELGYSYATVYDYYLVRGYAVVEACGIGTYGSEGFELCGTELERDSHKCVIEWLTGDRKAFTDKESNIEIKADWSNGNVAMTGCSYGGTLPFEVATTGVKGLKTIIPYAGIASWYDYTNSQGVPIIFSVNYSDYLAAYNCGGTFLDNDWTVLNDEYGSWLWQISQDQLATNGDYAPIWEESNYYEDYAGIQCSALIVHGLNDFNVTTRQADLMVRAFDKAGQNVKLVLHQDGHNFLYGTMVNGELWDEIQNKWLAHYLYGVENGIEDMPAVSVQSNIDGEYRTYDAWRDFAYVDVPVEYEKKKSEVSAEGLAEYAYETLNNAGYSIELMEEFYLGLEEPMGASYVIDLPDNTTVYGVPEIQVKLSTDVTDLDGLMISAILVDVRDDAEDFKSYMIKDRLAACLPVTTIGSYPYRDSERDILEFVQSNTTGRCISFGWTDLRNPGQGEASSDYDDPVMLEAGEFHDYTFYMLPTAYTVAPDHHLKLILTTWDPYRAFLDESFGIDPEQNPELIDYDYSYVIDNESIQVRIPVK